MKHLMLFFACLLQAVAAITGVSVEATTATQAILRFTAPDQGACTVEVSESPGFAPPVHDVDALLFPGSNLDNRTESTSSGRERVFVIGKRRAEKGLNGKWYSRALQAYTTHYYQITCGADQAAGSFSTTNIPLGDTYNEPLPPDPGAAGSTLFVSDGRYAWPEFTRWDIADPTARQETIIDPQTGALLKRITMPGDQNTGNSPAGDHFIVSGAASGANWSNPNNAVADDAASATYSAAGTDWLVLPVSIVVSTLQSLEVDLKAWCAGTCTDPVQVGLSVNGVNAWPDNSNTIEHVLGTSALPSSFTVFGGTSNVMAEWTPAGYQPLTPTDVNSRSGVVDVDAGGNVTWDSGDWFYPNWIAGSKITINSLVCTITGLTDPKHLAINPASCAVTLPATAKAYSAANFALMIRKKTATADSISVQYAKYNITQPLAPGWSSSGSPRFCSNSLSLNVATGAYGYRCAFLAGFPLVYWISATDASANYLGLFATGSMAGADGWSNNACNNDSVTFKATGTPNQDSFNCIVTDNTGSPGKTIILNCTLDSTNATANLSIACTNLTKSSTGKDLASLAANFTAGHATVYDPVAYSGCGISGIQNGQLMLSCRRSIQDTLSWVLVFDPAKVSNSAGCVGGGLPGCVIAAMNTWSMAPARYCALHTLFSSGDGATNIAWVSLKYFQDSGHAGAGAQISNLTSAALTATPGVAAGTGACPVGSAGCDNITVDGEPCNPFPSAGEGSNGSCSKNNASQGLQNAAVGDVLVVEPGPQEWVRIIAKTDATHWMIQRAIGPPTGSGPIVLNHSGLGTLDLWEFCAARPFMPRSDWSAAGVTWDFEHDPYGAGTVLLPFDVTHAVPRQSGVIGDGNYPVSASILGPPVVNATASPAFAGIYGITQAIEAAQTHPSHPQDMAPASQQKWLLDGRPLAGPGPSVINPFTKVSGQLYKVVFTAIPGGIAGDKDNFTNPTWGASGAQFVALNRKLQPTIAMSGVQPMIDISSAATGNVISDTNADGFRYCVVRLVNECRTGSAVGEIYMNVPYAKPRGDGTYGSESANATQEATLMNDMFVFNSDGYLNSVTQNGYQANDPTGALARRLTRALLRYRVLDVNMNVKTLPDASWLLFWNIAMPGAGRAIMAGKMPPYPAVDSVNRATFVPMVLSLSPQNGIPVDNAIVEFGYAENGAADQFYCTSRHESCLAVSSAVQNDPFKFPSDSADGTAAGITGVPCASGCSVAMPAIPQRLVYYKVQYRDSGNRVIAQTPLQVAAVP